MRLLRQNTHWPFWTAYLFLFLAELVRKGYKKSSVSFTLMSRKCQYTGQIVANITVLFFAVIPHGMIASVIDLAQNVKQKDVYIKKESLVIQE
jgi:hypothetical protein